MNMEHTDWNGCYNGGWQAAPLVLDAYSHPAKVSFALAERIYRHMLTEGWLAPGDAVIDPFGGIGGFAFHAALYGMHWTGVELEQKFVDLGNQNLTLWRNRYQPHFPGYGTARLVQGDSRRLVAVVTAAGGIVSSPPYAAGTLGAGDGPNSSGERHGRESVTETAYKAGNQYGATPGNLDRMPLGAMPAGVVSSPPYTSNTVGSSEGIDWQKVGDNSGRTVARGSIADGYGTTPGQLGAMPAGVVSSPPYAKSHVGADDNPYVNTGVLSMGEARNGHLVGNSNYGSTPGNIGNNTGDTFWSAAAQIVSQCYDILRPGGYAAFVTGDFVRNKRRVPFGEQWLALCETCGFEPVLWAVAHKSEYLGTQQDLFGGDVELTKTRVSFFRRLANQSNPDAAITNEDVIFVRKPTQGG